MITRPAGVALLCALVATLLAACDDTNPPSPLPATPDPARSTSLSPSSYLLRADQMPGYTRSSSATLSPGSLGDEAGDPSLKPTLEAQGMQYGARYTYIEPVATTSLAFNQVISQAILFNDAAGAQTFVRDEAVRRNVPPSNGGTVSTVTDFATLNSDQVLGFTAKAPADNPNTTVPPLTWLAVVRRGRVVVELVGSGTTDHATRANFDGLLALEQAMLATPPS